MSKSKHLIILSIISVLIFTFAIISCEKNGTGSNIVFEPKDYIGIYSIVKLEGMDVVTLIDTMDFRFTAGGVFIMKLDTILTAGQDRDFCDVTGEYSVSGNGLEIVIDTSADGSGTIYSQICRHAEIPEDKYIYYGRTGELVFDGSNSDLDRQIILFLEE